MHINTGIRGGQKNKHPTKNLKYIILIQNEKVNPPFSFIFQTKKVVC